MDGIPEGGLGEARVEPGRARDALPDLAATRVQEVLQMRMVMMMRMVMEMMGKRRMMIVVAKSVTEL